MNLARGGHDEHAATPPGDLRHDRSPDLRDTGHRRGGRCGSNGCPCCNAGGSASAPTPTGSARDAGIRRGGDAYLGWSQDSSDRAPATSQQAAQASPLAAAAQTPGIDVSKWQGNVDWASGWGQGKKFAYVKATEGTTYQNAYFAQQYNGRDAVIYSTTNWWTTCTGNTSQFSATNPLWIARYSSSAGTLPAGWAYSTFWQYTDSPIDQDYFNGDLTRLRALALG